MNKTIEEQIFDDITNMHFYLKYKSRQKYMTYLAKLELDLEVYYDIMKKEHPEKAKIMDYYHKIWEF